MSEVGLVVATFAAAAPCESRSDITAGWATSVATIEVATIEKVSARIRKVRFKVTPVMLSERAMTRPFFD
jgi:hypothetical protein